MRRAHDLTALMVCVHAIRSARAPMPDAEVQRVARALRRAWRVLARRVAPSSLGAHLEHAPALRAAMAPHRVVDALPPGVALPHPRCVSFPMYFYSFIFFLKQTKTFREDGRGRVLHALAHVPELVERLFAHEGFSLVWETSPALGMAHVRGCVYAVRAGSRPQCVRMRSQETACAMVHRAMRGAPDDSAYVCNVFE